MPELPDLEVFSKNLNKELAGKKVEEVNVINSSKLKVSKPELKKSLEGATVKKIYREGKELHIQFSNGEVLGPFLMGVRRPAHVLQRSCKVEEIVNCTAIAALHVQAFKDRKKKYTNVSGT